MNTSNRCDIPCYCQEDRQSILNAVDRASLILFDFDGVLVDTEGLHWRAYVQMCAYYGQTLTWDFPAYLSVAGRSDTALRDDLTALFPMLATRPWGECYAKKKELFTKIFQGEKIALMPGVANFIESCRDRRKPMCVVTHSPKTFIEHVRGIHTVFQHITHYLHNNIS